MDIHTTKTDRINNILFGDKEAGIEGIAYKVRMHDKYIKADKKIKWLGAGSMMAGGTAMGFWEQIKHFFFK